MPSANLRFCLKSVASDFLRDAHRLGAVIFSKQVLEGAKVSRLSLFSLTSAGEMKSNDNDSEPSCQLDNFCEPNQVKRES